MYQNKRIFKDFDDHLDGSTEIISAEHINILHTIIENNQKEIIKLKNQTFVDKAMLKLNNVDDVNSLFLNEQCDSSGYDMSIATSTVYDETFNCIKVPEESEVGVVYSKSLLEDDLKTLEIDNFYLLSDHYIPQGSSVEYYIVDHLNGIYPIEANKFSDGLKVPDKTKNAKVKVVLTKNTAGESPEIYNICILFQNNSIEQFFEVPGVEKDISEAFELFETAQEERTTAFNESQTQRQVEADNNQVLINQNFEQSKVDISEALDVISDLENTYAPRLVSIESEMTDLTTQSAQSTQLFNETIANVTIDSEVITARNSEAKEKTFTVLDERLEEIETEYVELEREITELSYITQRYTVDSWQKVQELVRAGLADKAFKIGDQLVSGYGESGQIVWDVIGINHDIPSDKKYKNSLTLQAHDCILNAIFNAPEALHFAETGLVAGTYHFTNGATKYQFTLTQPVPAGGHITFPWAYDTDILTTQIKTYASKASTTVIESASISVGSNGTELTGINDINHTRYGSNNYIESALKQWLNSNAATFAWVAKTNFDRPPTGAPYTGAGFLKLLDPEMAAVLGAVDKQVARNTITDGGGQDIFSDKVFLLSRKEVYGGDEGVVIGENPYRWYSALAANPTVNPLTGRIKYLGGSARNWWLRSPGVGYSHLPCHVQLSGSVYGYDFAGNIFGLAPACCIV